MTTASTYLLIAVLGGALVAQDATRAAKPAARAVIEGIVIKEPGSEPVKKALIELITENQAEGGNYTAITGPDGMFHIAGIVPGRYHLFAERTGFLETDKHHGRSEGRLLTLVGGQEIKDLQIRLEAAAVVRGRVTDEDGDPLPNAQVGLLRQTFTSGRGRWEQVGSERTNDLGEYRIAPLPAGTYYVSVNPPPDFKDLIENSNNAGSAERRNAGANEKPAMSYQTTYYPGTTDRSQASPVTLHPGDDFPLNFSLVPGPSLSIRGSVVNLPPRSSAAIVLQSRDFNIIFNGAEMHKDGSFVIRDVSPGAYTILATVENANPPMMARQVLQVSGSVDGLHLAPQPGGWVHGRLRLESKGNMARFDPSQIFLTLHPADGEDDTLVMGEGFASLAHVAADGSFEWKNVPPGNYYVQLAGDGLMGDGWFLKSAMAGGRDLEDSGISVNGGSLALDLVASANAAFVEGVVSDRKGTAVANAVVVAVPAAPLRGRVDSYRKTVSDQSGHFVLRGLSPGDYTLFAWESVEGGAYYNPDFLKNYDARGTPLRASEGERKSVALEVIAEEERE